MVKKANSPVGGGSSAGRGQSWRLPGGRGTVLERITPEASRPPCVEGNVPCVGTSCGTALVGPGAGAH